MKDIIKKVLLREFGETIDDYDTWLESIYEWTSKPIYQYSGDETIAYNENENYLGYWDHEQNSGFVVTELVD